MRIACSANVWSFGWSCRLLPSSLGMTLWPSLNHHHPLIVGQRQDLTSTPWARRFTADGSSKDGRQVKTRPSLPLCSRRNIPLLRIEYTSSASGNDVSSTYYHELHLLIGYINELICIIMNTDERYRNIVAYWLEHVKWSCNFICGVS